MLPWLSNTTPEPTAPSRVISTTEGRTFSTTVPNSWFSVFATPVTGAGAGCSWVEQPTSAAAIARRAATRPPVRGRAPVIGPPPLPRRWRPPALDVATTADRAHGPDVADLPAFGRPGRPSAGAPARGRNAARPVRRARS